MRPYDVDGKRIYLAGPMTGYPSFNFPAFHEATAALRTKGAEVFSPAERDEKEGFNPATDEAKPLAYYMQFDLADVCTTDAVVCLPGWQESKGARLETFVARYLGNPVVAYPGLHPIRHPSSDRFHQCLSELGELHDRKQADYGRGDDPFANVRASHEWGIEAWVGAMVRLTDKVRRLQSLVLTGSLANEGAVDSFMDIAVYATIARVLFEESGTGWEGYA